MNSNNRSNGPRYLWFLVLAALVLGGTLIYWRWDNRSSEVNFTEDWAEVPRAELSLVEGSLYQVGHTNSFTGFMVEFYVDQSLKSRSMVSNGVLHGISEGWHTNGQISVREHFQAGVSHGQRTKWYLTGTNLSEASIVNGQLDGAFLRWHENGVLSEEMSMQQGKPEGISRSYYPSGFLKAEVTLQDGKPVEQQFWKDGEFKRDIVKTE